jgi:protein-L-isoaspartate(D-aspartate) O-methyltransferase
MPWAHVVRATPGVLGAPDRGPFDRILVSAEPDELPQELLDQLGPGGVMVIPVGGRLLRVHSTPAGPDVRETGFYRFVPLVGDG